MTPPVEYYGPALDMLALEIVNRAKVSAREARKRAALRGRKPATNEAEQWLDTTGREWLEALGQDAEGRYWERG